MATGYEDIERLTSQQQTMLDEATKQQNDIVNQQTQMNIDALERNKQNIDKEATQTNRALYQQYQKAINPYGAEAENIAGRGLGNSGYAETTMSRLYNTYQNNITSTLNNARELKSNVDFQINQARQTGNITLAQNQLQLYMQKMQLLSEEYDLRNNREQFLYQKEQDALAQRNWKTEFDYQKAQNDRNYNYQIARDRVSDNQWQQNFDYNKMVNDRNYNYQVSRDKISDNQWLQNFNYQKAQDTRNYNYQVARDKVSDSQWKKEYELSKKAKASSSVKSTKSSKATGGNGSGDQINVNDSKLNNNAQNVLKGVQDIVKGIAKTGATAIAVNNSIKTGNIVNAINILKNSARDSLYGAYQNGSITDKEAEAIANKLKL